MSKLTVVKMKKDEQVNLVKDVLSCSKKDVEGIISDLDIYIETIADNLVADKTTKGVAKIGKYITIEKVLAPEKEVKNPKTGETFVKEEELKVTVKRTSALKKLLADK